MKHSPRPAARPAALDRTITYRLHKLHKLTDRGTQAAYLKDSDLLMSEGRCLAAIGTFAPLSVNDLAQRANLTKGQASRAAQLLVDQGLVSKKASAADGRGVVLALSRKGTARWQRVMHVITQRNGEICDCLSAGERELLGRLLDRLIVEAERCAAPAAGEDN